MNKPDRLPRIARRKEDHLRICLDEAESQFDFMRGGFEAYQLEHRALPELALSDIDLSTELVGKRLAAPILLSSMTGGPRKSAKINRHLAGAAQKLGLGMGVGSQRIALLHQELAASFEVRDVAPDIVLFANLGAVQLNYGFGEVEAVRAVEMIGADGLFLHLNPLQEAVQAEGDTNFRGLLARIGELARRLPFPILVKEVGAGIAADLVVALVERGVFAVDVSGAGGTSWSRVEGRRSNDPRRRRLAETFANWGLPTPHLIREGRRLAPSAKLIASGGLRTGLDAAKAIALGADLVSFAQPLLAPALESQAAVEDALHVLIEELRVACFCAGARAPRELRAHRLRGELLGLP